MATVPRSSSERAVIGQKALPMPLAGFAVSEAADGLVSELLFNCLTSPPSRPTSIIKYRLAIGALLSDLMRAESKGRWGKRSLSTQSFVGGRFGDTIFRPLYQDLRAAGMLEFERGHRQSETFDPTLPPYVWGRLSCFRLTDLFWRRAEGVGITLAEWKEHFAPGTVKTAERPNAPFVELRAPSGPNARGQSISFSVDDPGPKAILEELHEINRFLSSRSIEGMAFGGLRRLFTGSWTRHGRFYSRPGGHAYERWSAEDRLTDIRLDGEAVVEVDIGAAHLTILYGLQSASFDPEQDPYTVDGVNDRNVVKAWVTRVLGSGRYDQKSWNAKISMDFTERTGLRLGDTYPISQVRRAVLTAHPVMKNIGSLGIDSLDLQFIEAEIMKEAMRLLRDRDVTSLPMHDGLIVPASASDITKEALTLAFSSYFKARQGEDFIITPRLKVDPGS